MNQELQVREQASLPANITENLVINGDLSRLTPQDKVKYYIAFCDRIGLDPATQPFTLLKLNGKEVLYAGRGCAQQLCSTRGISHRIEARETVESCYVVTATAFLKDGRQTTSIGAVPIAGLKGDALCNAMMKAETKAKRRSTLDLVGLGCLDETEVSTIPGAQPLPAPQIANAGLPTAQRLNTPPAPEKPRQEAPSDESSPFNEQQQSHSEQGSQHAEGYQPKEGEKESIGKIELVTVKPGTGKNGKPFSKVGIKQDGCWFNSFDTKFAEVAEEIKSRDAVARIWYSKDEYGNKIAHVEEAF